MLHRSSDRAPRRIPRGWFPSAMLACGLLHGCAAPEAFHGGGDAGISPGSGGGSGGQSNAASGGAPAPPATGGATAGTGGTTPGTGGRLGSGGSALTGGASGTGGRLASGGMFGASGGAPAASGGRPGSGGAIGTGGATPASGGAPGAGGTPSTTTVLSDDFAQGAGQWMGGDAADWSIAADGAAQVYKEGTLSNIVRTVSAGSAQWSDVTIEARVKVVEFGGQSTSYQAMVCGRFKDPNNYYYVALDGTGKIAIKKNTTAISHTTIVSASASITAGRWYTVKLHIAGTALSAFLDGVSVLTTTDRDLATGGVGLGTRNATAAFGAVRVTSP